MKRSPARRWIACPPATEPVNTTKSIRAVGDHRGHVVVGGDDVLEHARRAARRRRTRSLKRSRAQQRLGGVLEHDRVAGQQRRHDRVDGAQVRVVPRRHDQHRAERVAADELAEAVGRVDLDVGQPLGGDRDHVARPLLEAAPDLVGAEPDRPAHLVGELDGDLVGDRPPSCCTIRSQTAARSASGVAAHPARASAAAASTASSSAGVDGGALGEHRAVDGRHDLLHGHGCNLRSLARWLESGTRPFQDRRTTTNGACRWLADSTARWR